MIPQIIHFVWIGPDRPDWAEHNIAEFRRLNPDHEIRVHGEEVLLDDYRARYEGLTEPCSKADLLRYSALERYGGWYFDVDYLPFRPLCDAERAWALDDRRVFIGQVWDDPSNPGWLGNGMIACGTDCGVWPRMRELVKSTEPVGRLAYGPAAIRRLHHETPDAFVIAGVEWFHGIKPDWSGKVYRAIRASGSNACVREFDPRMGGQLPFAMHLWAWKYAHELEAPGTPSRRCLGTIGEGRRVAAVLTLPGYRMNDEDSIFTAIARGLAKCGYRVELLPYEDHALSYSSEIPAVAVVWNGRKGAGRTFAQEARRLSVPELYVEHGFFDRAKHVQVDHGGFLHWASWRRELRNPAPADGAERLSRVWPSLLEAFGKRKGYVLVIGQLRGDTQLAESEINMSVELERLVARSLPDGVQAVFRPHPKARRQRSNYLPLSKAATLEEAVRGARFAVIINSNSGNECLALGCPILCLGPALYEMAGVAKQTTVRTFRKDLAAMLDGWHPDGVAVRNYLHWLACRQWNAADLADGRVMEELVRRAFA